MAGKKKSRSKKEESPLFVGITSGNELKMSMLECSKNILESLKDYESFQNLRDEKINLINQFKNDVKEVSRLINALKRSLPKVNGMEIKKPEVRKAKEEKQKDSEEKRPMIKTELERLEEELNALENKINSLR